MVKAKGDFLSDNDKLLVEWDEKYSVRIPFIDDQHKQLIKLTNDLYEACLNGAEEAKVQFKEAVRGMVDYTRSHFKAEEQILDNVNYPGAQEHKRDHEALIKQILDAVKKFEDGKQFIPNTLVRTLKDWILTHIAVQDLRYAEYILNLKKQGILNTKQGL